MYVLVLDDDDNFHGVFQHAKKHSFQVEFLERHSLPNVNRITLTRNYVNERRRLWKISSDIKKENHQCLFHYLPEESVLEFLTYFKDLRLIAERIIRYENMRTLIIGLVFSLMRTFLWSTAYDIM